MISIKNPKLTLFKKIIKTILCSCNFIQKLEKCHASIPRKTEKRLSFGPLRGILVQKPKNGHFCQNTFHSIFNLYIAVTSCKKSEKLNASICLKTQKSHFGPQKLQNKVYFQYFFQLYAFTLV